MTIATSKADAATNRDTLPRELNAGRVAGNKLRRAYSKYTVLGTEAATCVIDLGIALPKDAVISPLSSIYTQDLGTGVQGAIGDGTTADKFLAATALTTAGRTYFPVTTPAALTAETKLYLTFSDGGSFAVTQGQYFEVEVYYSTPN